jgi:hypothetical protein
MLTVEQKNKRLAYRNEVLRSTLIPGPRFKVVFSEAVGHLVESNNEAFNELITKVRAFKDFNKDNDPYGMRDMGRVKIGHKEYFFKIDLYDSSWEWGFDVDEMDPDEAHHLLMIMEASEY